MSGARALSAVEQDQTIATQWYRVPLFGGPVVGHVEHENAGDLVTYSGQQWSK